LEAYERYRTDVKEKDIKAKLSKMKRGKELPMYRPLQRDTCESSVGGLLSSTSGGLICKRVAYCFGGGMGGSF
jgi:hypothetical protein